MEEQEEQELREGRGAFPAFRQELEKAYCRRAKDLDADRQRKQEAAEKERQETERGYLEFNVTVKIYSGRMTQRQDSFIQSLINRV